MNCEDFRNLYTKYSAFPLSRELLETNEFQEYEDHYIDCDSCKDWNVIQSLMVRGIDLSRHCCIEMTDRLADGTKENVDPYDDPDVVMIYNTKFDEYGIPIQDGGSSFIKIRFCPWCGSKSPVSKRDRWYEELKVLGFSNPFEDEIPEKYKSDKWYREDS
jgi:hypothetical protein